MTESSNPFKLNGSREVYKNPWIQVREDSVTRPDGRDGIFGVVTMQPGVTVVALTTDNRIFLAKEYKYAVGRYTLECISGGLNNTETVLEAAKRELREEVGAETENWTDLGSLDPFTGVVSSPNHMYLAREVKISSEQDTDGGEVIDLVNVPFEQALNWVKDGKITHGASVVAILKTHFTLNSL